MHTRKHTQTHTNTHVRTCTHEHAHAREREKSAQVKIILWEIPLADLSKIHVRRRADQISLSLARSLACSHSGVQPDVCVKIDQQNCMDGGIVINIEQ